MNRQQKLIPVTNSERTHMEASINHLKHSHLIYLSRKLCGQGNAAKHDPNCLDRDVNGPMEEKWLTDLQKDRFFSVRNCSIYSLFVFQAEGADIAYDFDRHWLAHIFCVPANKSVCKHGM